VSVFVVQFKEFNTTNTSWSMFVSHACRCIMGFERWE